jgi:hypothetical protein
MTTFGSGTFGSGTFGNPLNLSTDDERIAEAKRRFWERRPKTGELDDTVDVYRPRVSASSFGGTNVKFPKLNIGVESAGRAGGFFATGDPFIKRQLLESRIAERVFGSDSG